MHYYKMNIADWNLSTSHLSTDEESIYFRLINHYYNTETPIPTETQVVFRRLRIAKHSDKATDILNEFFTLTDRGWTHSRCDKELKEYKKKAKTNKANGAKGGRPKNDEACGDSEKKANDNPEKPTGLISEPKHNPNQEPLTINQEPLTNKKNKEISPKLDYSSWPELPDEQILKDWHAMRKRWKANVSQTVVIRFGNQLQKAVEKGYSVNDCMSECVTRNWKGFKWEWMANSEQQTNFDPKSTPWDD